MRETKTDVCFTFHVGTRFGKLYKHQGFFSLTGILISFMALTTLKSYNFGFMLVLITLWKTAAHTNPERQTLLVLRASSCIKQEDIVETLKYLTALNTISHRSSEKQKHPNAKRGKHKTKYCFHSPQATFCTNTRLWNVLLHLKTVHIAVPFNPNASFLFLWYRTQKH